MPIKAQTGPRYSFGPFPTRHEKEVGGQHHVSAALPPENAVPIVQGAGLGGTENFASIGIRLWTVQPIASRYTDYAIPAAKPGGASLKSGRSA